MKVKLTDKKSNKKQSLSQEDVTKQTREKTAQQWIPVADIDGTIVYRKDNILVAALRVQPENLDLFSDNEKRRRISMLAEGINGETEGMQIFCIGRPVDLNNFLEWLQDKAKMEQDFTRKNVLKGYIKQASEMASSGETIERRFYIIITKPVDNRAEVDLIDRIKELQSKLSAADLVSHICKDDELLDVYSLFANPVQAGFERNEIQMVLPPVLVD